VRGKMFDILSSDVLDRASCTSDFLLEDEYRCLIHLHTFEAHKVRYIRRYFYPVECGPCLESLLTIADDVFIGCRVVSKKTFQKEIKSYRTSVFTQRGKKNLKILTLMME
jgi:hypothetical protein